MYEDVLKLTDKELVYNKNNFKEKYYNIYKNNIVINIKEVKELNEIAYKYYLFDYLLTGKALKNLNTSYNYEDIDKKDSFIINNYLNELSLNYAIYDRYLSLNKISGIDTNYMSLDKRLIDNIKNETIELFNSLAKKVLSIYYYWSLDNIPIKEYIDVHQLKFVFNPYNYDDSSFGYYVDNTIIINNNIYTIEEFYNQSPLDFIIRLLSSFIDNKNKKYRDFLISSKSIKPSFNSSVEDEIVSLISNRLIEQNKANYQMLLKETFKEKDISFVKKEEDKIKNTKITDNDNVNSIDTDKQEEKYNAITKNTDKFIPEKISDINIRENVEENHEEKEKIQESIKKPIEKEIINNTESNLLNTIDNIDKGSVEEKSREAKPSGLLGSLQEIQEMQKSGESGYLNNEITNSIINEDLRLKEKTDKVKLQDLSELKENDKSYKNTEEVVDKDTKNIEKNVENVETVQDKVKIANLNNLNIGPDDVLVDISNNKILKHFFLTNNHGLTENINNYKLYEDWFNEKVSENNEVLMKELRDIYASSLKEGKNIVLACDCNGEHCHGNVIKSFFDKFV